MKKLFFLLAMALTTVTALAQNWKVVEPDGQEFSSTWVIAQLKTNLTETQIVIGAFVDGECRAIVQPESATTAEGAAAAVYSIRVPSYVRNGENGKTISFKAYDPKSGLEYTLRETLVFENDGTHGSPTAPVTLNLTAPLSYSITLGEVQVGQSYPLADYLEVSPADAILPDNLVWTATQDNISGGVSIVDGVLTASDTTQPVVLSVSAAGANKPLQTVTLDVVSHATGIRLTLAVIEVEKSDFGVQQLNQYVSVPDSHPYVVLPEGSTDADRVQWEVEAVTGSQPVLQFDGEKFLILRGGEARIRPYVTYQDKNKLDANGKPQTVTVYPTGTDGQAQWITVKVSVPVESVDINEQLFGSPVRANMTDTNLYQRLASLVTILPQDASNRNFRFQCSDGSVRVDNETHTITPLREGEGIVYVITEGRTAQSLDATANDATSARELTMEIALFIENPAVDAQLQKEALSVIVPSNGELALGDLLKDFITYVGDVKQNISINITPIQGTSVTGEAHIGGPNGDVYNLVAKGNGTTKLQIELQWKDYDKWKGNPAELPTGNKKVTFDVIVQEALALNRFYAKYTQAVTDREVTLTLTPEPANATFDPEDVVVNFTLKVPEQYADNATLAALYQKWSPKVVRAERVSATQSEIVWKFTSTVPGEVSVSCQTPIYEGQDRLSTIDVGYGLVLNKDWQWRSNPWGGVAPADIATVYGGEGASGKLEEIRTQTDLLYNDENYGYFGTLMDSQKGLSMYECYKVKMKEAFTGVIYSDVARNASALAGNMSLANGGVAVTIATGWNWVGCPYYFNRSIAKVMEAAQAQLPEGLVIVGKEGSVEYDPNGTEDTDDRWSNGTIDCLKGGQGYLIYNPGETFTLSFPPEMNWEPEHEDKDDAAGVKAFSMEYTGIWSYNHTHFMNNMTIVAELCGIDHPEDYSVGAFVGNECRGEGVVRNGKVFITVHSDGGEYVHFRLYNRSTGEMQDLREGLRTQTRVGSLKAPFLLHTTTTAIDALAADGDASASVVFDLTGRRVGNSQPGISLQRRPDGSYRKVVVK